MANHKAEISAIVCFCKYFGFCAVQISCLFLKKNLTHLDLLSIDSTRFGEGGGQLDR